MQDLEARVHQLTEESEALQSSRTKLAKEKVSKLEQTKKRLYTLLPLQRRSNIYFAIRQRI